MSAINFVSMGSIKVVVWDEGWELEDFYFEITKHAESHHNQGDKGHYIISRAHHSIAVSKDNWLHSSTRCKGPSFELQKVTAIGSSSF
jgi:hypothetical protein